MKFYSEMTYELNRILFYPKRNSRHTPELRFAVKWTNLTQHFLLLIQRFCITEVYSAKDTRKYYCKYSLC